MPIQFGKIANNGIFANATATVESGFVRIIAPPEADKINFYAPADFSLATVYTVNGVQVELANMQDSIPSVSWITGAPLSCIYERDEEKLYISTMYGDSALHSAVFINSTAIMQDGVMVINSPDNAELINFITPSDASEVTQVTVNGTGYPLTDLAGSEVPQGWVSGVPISLVLHDNHLWLNTISTGGSGGATHDLPPLNPNFTMEISEGDSEDTVTVTADKLTISPTTDMLAGGQWEYGTEMSPAPGKGQNIKHWTREQLVTSAKPFDGLLLGDVTASDAVNETILWLPENQNRETVLVPFIVLSVDYLGGVYLRRKNATVSLKGQNTYPDSETDVWCETTYLNSVLDNSVVSAILSVDIQTDGTSINRKCFILSATEYDSSKGSDGTAMPYFSTAANRITRNDSGTAVGIWTRTRQENFLVYVVNTGGAVTGQYLLTNNQSYACPAFVLPKDFQIQQRPDGSYTVYNDYGLITLKNVKVSDSSSVTKIHVRENSGVYIFDYVSSNYNGSDRGCLFREEALDGTVGTSVTYPSGGAGQGASNWEAALPSSLRNLISEVTIKYKNATSVQETTARAFVPSIDEMYGTETNYGTGTQWSMMKISANRIRHYNGSPISYWLRDAASSTTVNYMYTSGNYNSDGVNYQKYCVPAFTLPLTAPIRLLADGTYDLVPEDPSLSAQTVSTLAEGKSGTAVQLNQIPAGSVLKIKENGQDVDFYVAKHDYESELNGAGRTLMVRKDCYDNQVWDSGNVNAYAESDIDSWFNNTYKSLLDERIQEAIGTTKFHYTPGNGNNTVGTLERAIFALSLTELGQSNTYANTEGSALPIASTLQVAYRNGKSTPQWTRSPVKNYTGDAWWLDSNGNISSITCNNSYGSRPVFTLPGDSYATANDDGTYTFTGEDTSSPTVSFSFTVPHGTQPVVRQYTYNHEEHYQTMLEGGVLPALGGDTGPTYSEVLAENTWAQIAQAVADKDPILDVWQIGDTKDEVIAGETLTFAIMGKNMDDLADGSGKAGLTFGMTQLMASTRKMNSSNTNAGSFAGSAMYSWLSETIYPNLPAELKDAIKAVNKKTSSGGDSSVIRTDSMYLWLFAEIEVFGTTTYSYAGEGTQYPYFATAAERIKRLSNGAGAASDWWERSPRQNYDGRHFCLVDDSGRPNAGNGTHNLSRGVCFGFCI